MFNFAYGVKNYLAPLVALQIAQQVLVNNGFEVYDPVQPGKITVGGNHYGAGVMVTVVSMDCEGGAATVINAFTANQNSIQAMRSMADTVCLAIQNA